MKLPQGPFAFRRYSQVFGFLPKEPEKAVPGLIELLGEKDQSLRNAALETLGGIGPAAKDAVPALVHVLQYDEWTDVRAKAAKTLGDMGPAAKEAILVPKSPSRSIPTNIWRRVHQRPSRCGARSYCED